ncbi:MAG: 2-hydroxy-3-oxopropionate reductase [Mycobacterium sp.]|nr:2-hydroxy-3-oxopropionate reductase [Mycobacterium sp.]
MSSNDPLSVAVIGLGPMGAPIARNLVSAGFDVAVWNRTRSVAMSFAPAARTPERLEDLDSAVVISVLPDVDQLESLASDDVLRAWAAAGTERILIMSTTSPNKVTRFAAAVAPYGIAVIDAPMSGGDKGAQEGTLSVMVGCTADEFASVTPILEAIGKTIERMGDVGAGSVAKLCNQMVVASTMTTVAESLSLARTYGLDLERLVRIFQGGLASTAVLALKRDKFLERTYDVGGSAKNQLKDLEYARSAAEAVGARADVLSLVTDLFAELVRDGFGESDHSVVQELFARAADET